MGRPRKGDNCYKLQMRIYDKAVFDNFTDLSKDFETYGEALQYLLDVEKKYHHMTGQNQRPIGTDIGTSGQHQRPKSVPKEFYKSVEEEFQEDDPPKLYFPFEKTTWHRYDNFCRKTCPLWSCTSHNEKMSMIVQMAEKYYALVTNQKDGAKANAGDGGIQYSLTTTVTPPRSTAPKNLSPSTPTKSRKDTTSQEKTPKKKAGLQDQSELGVYGGVEGQDKVPNRRRASSNYDKPPVLTPEEPVATNREQNHQPTPAKGVRVLRVAVDQNTVTAFFTFDNSGKPQLVANPSSPQGATSSKNADPPTSSADPEIQAPKLSSNQGPQVLEVGMETSLWEKYTNFFNRHSWAEETEAAKVAILLEIAENASQIASIEDIESRRALIKESASTLEFPPPSQEGSVESVGDVDISSIFTLKIPLPQSIWERYNSFFYNIGLTESTNFEKFKMLIGSGEARLDLGLMNEGEGGSLETYQMPSVWMEDPKKKKGRYLHTNSSACSTETTPFLLWLTQDVKKRVLGEESDQKKLVTLLKNLTDKAYRRADQNSEGQKSTASQTEDMVTDFINDNESIASDGTWDDETETFKELDDQVDVLEEDTPAQAEQDKPKVASLRLLKPGYYMKFSEEARKTIEPKSKRSVAAIANTRRHIVERPQLKRLIAQCKCTNPSCNRRIENKSILIKDFGWTIRVTARCQDGKKHKFLWASSGTAPHKSAKNSLLYTLNTVIPSAVYLSGNNMAKLNQFSKVLRLTWGHQRTQRPALQVTKQVTRKCFGITQQEMLENLKKESGDVVLAGDGQFDSPGSCATQCTYTLMALGVDEEQEDGTRLLKKCDFVISQAVIDRRHADNKSVNMERVGLHWALQPIIQAGIKVAELATDDHIQITTDFRKIAAAVAERRSNAANGNNDSTALKAFKDSLSTALLHYQPPIDLTTQIMSLLSYYARIIHSNDIWHRAKNLLKTVSTIAQGAPSKEQQTYRRYAKMLRNFLWDSSKQSKGSKEKFLDQWLTLREHLHDNHKDCDLINLHSKTNLMSKLDQTTRSFDLLIKCIRRVEASAPQLCRFRHTGMLEAYNGLTLKYCPKRIFFQYDTMVMRKDLAALDHNHHVLRSIKLKKDGKPDVIKRAWRKSTKTQKLEVQKEKKDYKYIGHLLAAILIARCEPDCSYETPTKMSAAHPWRIYRSLGAAYADQNQTQQARPNTGRRVAQQQRTPKTPKTAKSTATKRKPRKRQDSSASASTPNSSSDEESDDFGSTAQRMTKRKRQSSDSDSDWTPEGTESAQPKKKRCGKTKTVKLIEMPDQQQPVHSDQDDERNQDVQDDQEQEGEQNMDHLESEPSTSGVNSRKSSRCDANLGPKSDRLTEKITATKRKSMESIDQREEPRQEFESSESDEGSNIWDESVSDEGSDNF